MKFAKPAARRISLADSILPLYAQGKGHKTIAKELGISPRITRTVLIEQGVWKPGTLQQSEHHRNMAAIGRKKWREKLELKMRLRVLLARNRRLICATRDKWIRHAAKERKPHVARTYFRNKYQQDTQFRIIQVLRSRLRKVAGRGRGYSGNNLAWLGCTPDQLRAHLEAQFTKGMGWHNLGVGRGRWNIDHVIPCNAFDMNDERQRKACFHYTNLKPRWAIHNIKKSDRHTGHNQLGLI